jgi:hypothetical protein
MIRSVLWVAIVGATTAGCRLNGLVGDHPGRMAKSPEPALVTETTREVLTKRAPDTLMARDGSSCRVEPTAYAATAVGTQFRCPWVPGSTVPGA